jgi:SAM-dependent methyltransferase
MTAQSPPIPRSFARIDGPAGRHPEDHPTVLSRCRPRPLTCLGDAAELDTGGVSRFAGAMPPDYGHRANLRKWWEWDFLAKSAEELGVLNSDSVGVGLGVGDEPLIFYFANYCKKIIATDLYSASTIWKEARFAQVEAVYQNSPIPFPRDRVEVRHADMRTLGMPNASADFAWSCSSIEHVPTLRDLMLVFDELARVLKIGGYALLTTEFCLTQPPYVLPGVNAWDPNLFVALANALGAFEFVGVTDLSHNFAHPANAPKARRHRPAGMNRLPAVPLQASYRAGQMANMVGLSVITPIAFVLKRREGSNAAWNDLEICDDVRVFSESVAQLKCGQNKQVVRQLEPLFADGPDRLSLQFYHHVGRYFVESLALDRGSTHPHVASTIDRFIQHLPHGDVQDADCLDMVGYLLGEAGNYKESAHVYRLAMNSPSTSQDHVVKLAFDYCRVMKRAGHFRRAVDEAVPVLCDLVTSGIPVHEFEYAVTAGEKHAGLTDPDLRYLHYAFSDCLSQSAKNFSDGVLACTQAFDGILNRSPSRHFLTRLEQQLRRRAFPLLSLARRTGLRKG